MNQDTVIILLTIFVGLVALSQVGQMIALFALKKQAGELQKKLDAIAPRAESVLATAQQTVELGRKQLQDVSARAADILDSTRAQLARVDGLVADFSSRARTQMDRAELVLDDTFGRVQSTVSTVHGGVMRPIREISGVGAGIRAAVSQLAKGATRSSPAQATQDEEMFI